MEAQPVVLLALIAGVQLLLLTVVQALISSRKEKRDYARQDAVAARVVEAAAKVAEVARSAKAVNEAIADKLDQGLEQGKKIHILVNSDMTAARTNERDQTKLTLLALKQVQALGVKLGLESRRDELDAIERAEQRIEELNQILADRLAAQERVDQEAIQSPPPRKHR